VEGIPASIRTDEELRTYFEHLFPARGAVQSSIIVKHTDQLASLCARLASTRASLQEAEFAHDHDAIADLMVKVQTKFVFSIHLLLRKRSAKPTMLQSFFSRQSLLWI